MPEALKSMLSQHAVRIRQNDTIVGTGFLIVPKEGTKAYILTTAHVLCTYPDNLNIQFLGIADQNGNTRFISDDMVTRHRAYHHEQSRNRVQYCDVAYICIAKEAWMNTISRVFWGNPEDGMPIQAVGFASINPDPELPHSSVFHQTEVGSYTPDTHRISATIQGDFILNHADLDNDIQGMSGTVFAATGQDAVIIIGMMVATTGENAAFGQMNMVDTTGILELLKEQGVMLEQNTIKPVPTDIISVDMETEDFILNRHFVHRNNELEHIQVLLQNHRHVVLSGMGGIGKTELARQYAEQHYCDYHVVHQINCTDGAAIGFSQVSIPGIERTSHNNVPESDESLGRRKLDWLHQQSRDYLLILDDLSPSDSDISAILSLPVDRIMTSRWDRSSWNCQVINIDALATSAERQSLFESYLEYPLSPEELADFKAIDTLVEGHTLTLQLIALQCSVADTPLYLIRSALESQGVYTNDPNVFTYGNSSQEKNAYGHIRTIWNFAILQNRQNDIMQALSLLSPAHILRTECRDWLELSNLNDINHLIRSGWLQYQRINGMNTIRVHTVIADIICREKCQSFPDNLSSMIGTICNNAANRDLNIEERMRYIHLAEQLARRLPPAKETIRFIQILSMEEESIRQFAKGEALLNRSAKHLKDLQLQSHILQVDNDSDMGIIFQGQRNFDDARTYLQKARKGYEQFRDIYPARYGIHLYNEARFLEDIEKFEDAFRLIRQAEPICKKHAANYLGKVYDAFAHHYSNKARSENTLARVARSPGAERRCHRNCVKYIQMECDYWQLAVETKETFNSGEEFDAMVSKSNLACAKSLLKDQTSIPIIKSVLEFYVRTAGEHSDYVAETYSGMCMIYENLGDHKASVEYGKKAENILIELYGPDSPDLRNVYHNLLFPLRALDDKSAVAYYTA